MKQQNQIYMALLLALAFFYGVGIISLMFVGRNLPPESRQVFHMVCWMEGALIAAMLATLIVRITAPNAARVVTMAMNIVLLIAFPFGTALGIYGLLKVDRPASPPPLR